MRTFSTFPALSPDIRGRFLLPLAMMVSVLLGGSLILLSISHYVLHQREKNFIQNMMIALPPSFMLDDAPQETTASPQPDDKKAEKTDGDFRKDPRIFTIIKKIYRLPHVSNIHILKDSDIQTLLSKIGYFKTTSLPIVITFSYDHNDIQHLQELLHHIQPDSLLIPPPPQVMAQNQQALSFARSLYEGAVISGIIVSFSAIFLFSISLLSILRQSLARQATHLTLLFQLGASPKLLYRRIFNTTLRQCFIGGWVGVGLSIFLANISVHILQPFLGNLPLPTTTFLTELTTTSPSAPSATIAAPGSLSASHDGSALLTLFFLSLIPFLLTLIAAGLVRKVTCHSALNQYVSRQYFSRQYFAESRSLGQNHGE